MKLRFTTQLLALTLTLTLTLLATVSPAAQAEQRAKFTKFGVIMYTEDTEGIDLSQLLDYGDYSANADRTTFESGCEEIVKIENNMLIPVGAGETRIKATWYDNNNPFNIYLGVKVIDPSITNTMFVRLKKGESVCEKESDSAKGVIAFKCPDTFPYYAERYIMLGDNRKSGSSNGITIDNLSNNVIYVEDEILWADAAILKNFGFKTEDEIPLNFKLNGAEVYQITNFDNKYLDYDKSTFEFRGAPSDATTSVSITVDENDKAKMHYSNSGIQNTYIKCLYNSDNNITTIQYTKNSSSGAKHYELPELYIERTIPALTLDGVKIIVGTQEYGVDNTSDIAVSQQGSTVEFSYADGLDLYYKLGTADAANNVAPLAETDAEFTKYAGAFTVKPTDNSIEYYTAAYGLKSPTHKIQKLTATTTTGIYRPDVESSPTYYDLNGIPISEPKSGLYIKRTAKGTGKIMK